MKRLVSVLVSLAFLAVVYSLLDVDAIIGALRRTDPGMLGLSLILLVGLIFVSALRLSILSRTGGLPLGRRKAIQATFAANALNMFLPGKLGDILKASLMAEDDSAQLAKATSLGIWEKISDLAALFLMASVPLALTSPSSLAWLPLGLLGLCGLAALLAPRILQLPFGALRATRPLARDWGAVVRSLRSRPGSLTLCLALTALLWLGHLVQISLMAASLGVSGDARFWAHFMALMPIAIVAGLIPLTFAGVGTRDAAIVMLIGAQAGPETAAALGVLFWLRYLVPGLIGSPLLPRFLRTAAAHRARFAK
ncbi:lysylphosphatidylglycerol synthase transmembrane domain-containing protein [Rhodovulum sulfidophilum]|uniref:lysylphosphatidylglycerol synthase transmembrane domain-containing protein n=1 Tax=Rhodovulum sulfidophilum TaxID=35806 RepID=UPI001F3B4180|nr:lysylphosphatidylglycerol synthase transmembrane domain-containing protein [Rhodovulum sulfidophilum]MCE8440415.1 flippase-like domain-containing protein [Rhodovulum sulfidophilum]MCE8468765.1 flippase-like domain-containing protein [Rhodovulum sulfidophilum]